MSDSDQIEVPHVPLAGQPTETPRPSAEWPTGDVPAGVAQPALLDELFDDTGPLAQTNAAVVVDRAG